MLFLKFNMQKNLYGLMLLGCFAMQAGDDKPVLKLAPNTGLDLRVLSLEYVRQDQAKQRQAKEALLDSLRLKHGLISQKQRRYGLVINLKLVGSFADSPKSAFKKRVSSKGESPVIDCVTRTADSLDHSFHNSSLDRLSSILEKPLFDLVDSVDDASLLARKRTTSKRRGSTGYLK